METLWNVEGGKMLVARVVILAVTQLIPLFALRTAVPRREGAEASLGKRAHALVEARRGDPLTVKSHDRAVLPLPPAPCPVGRVRPLVSCSWPG